MSAFAFGASQTPTQGFGFTGVGAVAPAGGVPSSTRGKPFSSNRVKLENDDVDIKNVVSTQPGVTLSQIRACDFDTPSTAPAAVPAAGGLFSGTSTTLGTPATPTGLTTGGLTGTGTGLFGSQAPATNTLGGGGLFGTPATTQPAPSLFGGATTTTPTTTPAAPTTSLFGGLGAPAAGAAPTTSLFGGASTTTPATSTSLFGTPATTTPATQQPTQGLFGSSSLTTPTTTPAATGSLFGGSTFSTTPSLFSTTPSTTPAAAPAATGTGLFGSFGVQPQPQQPAAGSLFTATIGQSTIPPAQDPQNAKKLELRFSELSQSESGFRDSFLSSFAPSGSDNKIPDDKKPINQQDENTDIVFVANPQCPFTRRLIRARPRLFNFN